MTREEAIRFANYAQDMTKLQDVKEFYALAEAALREQEERESVWHDAKDNPPKKPGLYYGKRDDTDSMYLCQYCDGVWTLDAYPETRMHVIKWAYYNAFAQEHEERRWIPVAERLPDIGAVVLAYSKIAGIYVDYYEGEAFGYFDVTHWMPLPEPPKEE